jgi:hypothetical protein
MKQEVFRYGRTAKYIRIMSVILSILILIRGSLYFFVDIYIIINSAEYGIQAVLLESWTFFANIVIAIFMLLFIFHIYSDIEIDRNGLRIKYIFHTLAIPWKNILGIENRSIFFGLIKRSNSRLIVCITGLPIIFRLYGLLWTGSTMPVIPINHSISGYQRLIERIIVQSKREDIRADHQRRHKS